MTNAWARGAQQSYSLPTGNVLLASLSAGQSILRVRFGWGFYGDTPLQTTIAAAAANLVVWGLVTTVGDGSETVPDPRTDPGDVDPPTQRWLWWETRAPIVQAAAPGLVVWGDSGPQEPCDAKGQVLATGLGDGQTLNLWASWALGYGWDAAGTGSIWLGYSILVRTP
jgi:hypothetical protein